MLNCFSDQVSNILTDIPCAFLLFPMNCNRFIGNFTAASGCFQLVPKYKMEVKLMKNKHQIFLPEINQFQENGSQPLNSHFFKGLTHCECRNSLGFWENRKYNTTHRKTSH